MELALYHPEYGYYARAARRSGRAGDFFTSVDVGRVFGELLAAQFGEMWRVAGGARCDLVEAGAGNGRLAADILECAAASDRAFYDAIDLSLVERSGAARDAQPQTLGPPAAKLPHSGATLPHRIDGILFANELLDALPTHVVVMRDALREVYVDWQDERLVEREDDPSTPALQHYLDRAGVAIEPGWRVELNLAAVEWMKDAARRLVRGFLLLIDYGHVATHLYDASHAAGTLTSYQRHAASSGADAAWLDAPGDVDMTSHVDLTTIQRVAEAEGLETIGILDQTYFLLGLGLADKLSQDTDVRSLKDRLALKTLMMPGGLGSVQKVMIFGKDVGRPALRGCSYKVRVT